MSMRRILELEELIVGQWYRCENMKTGLNFTGEVMSKESDGVWVTNPWARNFARKDLFFYYEGERK